MELFLQRNYDTNVSVDPNTYTRVMNAAGAQAAPQDPRMQAIKQEEQMYARTQSQKLMQEMLVGMANMRGMRGHGVPERLLQQSRGLNLTPGYEQAQLLQQETKLPLPFDQKYAKQANFVGIVNTLDPELHQANQQVIDTLKEQVPLAMPAYKQSFSIYEGVPTNFYRNRVYIALQRARENDVHAYV